MMVPKLRIAGLATLLLPATLLLLGACVSTPRQSGPDPALVRRLAQEAADQVKRCYRRPKVSSDARQIVTRLKVKFTQEGQLAQVPEIVSQRSVAPGAERFAPAMAQAATLAIIRCTPIKLPPEAYAGGWEELEFTFSPRAFG